MHVKILPIAVVLVFAGCKEDRPEPPPPPTFTQDDVLLEGTLHQGSGDMAAVFAVNRSTSASFGFGPIDYMPVRIDPAGRIVYGNDLLGMVPRLLRYEPDPLVWNGSAQRWEYPPDPTAGEEEIPTPHCAEGSYPRDWVMQGGTGAIMYQCGFGPYYDEAGNEFEGPIYAWNEADLKLGQEMYQATVIASDGSTISVTGLPDSSMLYMVAARAHGDGFRLVLRNGDVFSLYAIDSSGVATKEGTYAARPAGTTCGDQSAYALGADGVMYQTGWDEADPFSVDGDLVCRIPLEPGTSDVVYAEAGRPDWDFTDLDSLVVKAHGARLITGP